MTKYTKPCYIIGFHLTRKASDKYTVFPERAGFLNTFSLRHDINNGLLSDAIHVVYVELSKLQDTLKSL